VDQDTSPEARRRYIELLRSKTGPERLEATAAMTRAVRELCWAGLRHRHPDASESELKLRFVELVYGPGAATRLKPRL
jgi:hypothetical protein